MKGRGLFASFFDNRHKMKGYLQVLSKLNSGYNFAVYLFPIAIKFKLKKKRTFLFIFFLFKNTADSSQVGINN